MLDLIRRSAVTVAALGALGLGGAAIAGAADTTTTSPRSSQAAGRPQRQTLASDVAAKVEAAALAKVPGAIVRTETNSDSTAPYESHIKTSAGQELEVLVSKDFAVVDAREHPALP